MCFSANASFAASGVLAAVGAASVRESKTRRSLPYALIPLLFSVQQLIEGFQWLAAPSGSWNVFLAYGFLFFATVFWPAYVPLATYLIEPSPRRKRLLGYFVFLGAIIAVYSFVCLFFGKVAVSARECCHVAYSFQMPFKYAVGASYVVATCGSLFFSSHRWVKTMSVVIFVSLVASYLYATYAYVSVWCYFSAVLSAMVLIHLRSVKNPRTVDNKNL